MNYFAHGCRFVDDPYFLAGTAVPDWLSVVNRKVRAREKQAALLTDHEDRRVASLARGIVRHHRDDAWFHLSRAFSELSLRFAVQIRGALPGDEGFRPSFLGHIIVELLLDAILIQPDPVRLDEYYAALEKVDPALVESTVGLISGRPASGLADLIPIFLRERFLWDYSDDGKLLFRLNQVMRRVQLPALPKSFCNLLPSMRHEVHERFFELNAGPVSVESL
ncbi:MAG: hypothetical protein SGJ20_09150 [Planctomycetota bacterium]|nr:hypothetical protein [Planctomycetota bacterium]